MLSNMVYASVSEEDDIITTIESIKSEYEPGINYFVSNSKQKWVGEDNIGGDKTRGCFAPNTTNSHGRFGGLWQSMGFANYVFYNIYDEMPQFGYHCNPSELNDKVEVIARYASNCRYLKGTVNGEVTAANIKALFDKAKIGDILVVAPEKKCNTQGRAMVIEDINDASVLVYQADYKGICAVTTDTITFDALADYHCVSLLRGNDYPYPEPVPPAAVGQVTVSGNEFTLNEHVDVSWKATKHTNKYKV